MRKLTLSDRGFEIQYLFKYLMEFDENLSDYYLDNGINISLEKKFFIKFFIKFKSNFCFLFFKFSIKLVFFKKFFATLLMYLFTIQIILHKK
jgi:hypothetical protein